MSCTTVPVAITPAPPLDAAAHQLQLADIKHWKLKGKIGFKSEQNSLSATLHWQQQPHRYHIRLTSVLGNTLMDMRGGSGFAELHELHIDDEYYVDDNAEQLLKRVTGLQLPIDQLALLVKGQIPESGFEVSDESNNWPNIITESSSVPGWKIRYRHYRETQHPSGNRVWLPYELRLTKAKNLIKIRVTSWEIHE